MTGIGPVEPHDPGDGDALAPRTQDIVTEGPDSPRPRERWAALPPRTRTLLLAALTTAATVTGTLTHPRPEPPAPPPPAPWPAQVTHLRYAGTHDATFRFTARVDHEPTVTISHILAGDPRLSATTTPRPPVRVTPDTPRTLTVRIDVHDCAALPRALDMAYLDLTLHNRRATEQHSFIFVDRYPHDLLALLRTRCGKPRTELTQR
ncbi:hypothetical protein ACYBSK_08345 [Streptomyces sp. BYX5S]